MSLRTEYRYRKLEKNKIKCVLVYARYYDVSLDKNVHIAFFVEHHNCLQGKPLNEDLSNSIIESYLMKCGFYHNIFDKYLIELLNEGEYMRKCLLLEDIQHFEYKKGIYYERD